MTHSILHNCDTAEQQINDLEAEIERLRDAGLNLATWTQHHAGCPRSRSTAVNCTCGLHEAWEPFDVRPIAPDTCSGCDTQWHLHNGLDHPYRPSPARTRPKRDGSIGQHECHGFG